jgi:hypothetical protein
MTTRNVVWSYPCPTCDVPPGTNCRGTGGQVQNTPHAERAATVVRCPRCGNWLTAEDADAGLLCSWCIAAGHA